MPESVTTIELGEGEGEHSVLTIFSLSGETSIGFINDDHSCCTCMDVDVDSTETELNAYTRVQQVPLDTDPPMWWKQHVQEFPHLTRMVRQHLSVPATSSSPERLFSSVGLVKSDFRGRLLDRTLIDVMWAKQAP